MNKTLSSVQHPAMMALAAFTQDFPAGVSCIARVQEPA